jgi:HlyD family secretion protein
MKRGLIVFLVAVVVLGGGGWYAWTHRNQDQLQVQMATLTSGPIVRRVVVAGTLQPVRSVDVGSQVSGQIVKIEVDFNGIVKKGQELAQIDPTTFQAALADAQAALEQSQADEQVSEVGQLDAAQKLTRAKALVAKKLMAQSDYDAAQIAADSAAADVESAKASVTRAKANVDQAQTNLDHTHITSPVDGIVVNRAVDVGQVVQASVTSPLLFTLATSIETMQVQAQVDEADIASIKEGEDVTFQVESYPDEEFRGTVFQVRIQPGSTTTAASSQTSSGGPLVSSATNGITYTTIINTPNADHRLRPGMTATVLFSAPSGRGNVTRIPNMALLFHPSVDLLKAIGQTPPSNIHGTGSEDFQQVWTYNGKEFKAVQVQLGSSDAQFAEEASGDLKPGDKVVTNAIFGKVKPAPATPAAPAAAR